MAWLSPIASNVALASCLALAAWYVQCRLGRPAVARVMWWLVLVKLVTPPLVSISLVSLPATVACTFGLCNCQHTGSLAIFVGILPWALLAVWTAGAGAALVIAWRRWSQLQRLLLRATPAPAEWQSIATLFAAKLSIGQVTEILVAPTQLPPLVVPSWRRPRIVLPLAMLGRLNVAQREALLLHELVHIQRRDHLVRMLELAFLSSTGGCPRSARLADSCGLARKRLAMPPWFATCPRRAENMLDCSWTSSISPIRYRSTLCHKLLR